MNGFWACSWRGLEVLEGWAACPPTEPSPTHPNPPHPPSTPGPSSQVRAIVKEQGYLEVKCEFCCDVYRLDEAAVLEAAAGMRAGTGVGGA